MVRVWKIHACLPGLNCPFYIAGDVEPTHEQINAVWAEGKEEPGYLKSPEESAALPLNKAYPAYVLVEEVEVTWL